MVKVSMVLWLIGIVSALLLLLKLFVGGGYPGNIGSRRSDGSMSDTLELKNIVHDMEILRTKCSPVGNIDSRTLKNLDQMLEIMYANGGIGLAANQVGLTDRIVVIDLYENGVRRPMYLINPEIIEKSEETKFGPEGCLSIPVSEKSDVRRSVRIKVKYLDRNGKEIILNATGLLAICIQHEVDHLDGILYIDHLSKARRDFVVDRTKNNVRRLEKAKKN